MLGWFRQHKVLKQRECILNIITQPTDTSLTVGYDEAKIMISLFIPDGKPLTDLQFKEISNEFNSKLNTTEYVYVETVPELMITENNKLTVIPSNKSRRTTLRG